MKIPKNFTPELITLLRLSYPSLKKEDILKNFPNYKWRNLQNIANELKIKRETSDLRKGDISILFNKSFISFYWLGLILADGTILSDGTLKIDLAIKDKDYLNNLAIYLKTKLNYYPPYKSSIKGSTGIYRVKIKDFKKGVELRKYLGIINQKTYAPFSLDFIKNKYQLVAFTCGFIDGDGTINNNGKISIDCHKNYLELFNKWGNLLINYNLISKFSTLTYLNMCRLNIHIQKDTKTIKDLGIKMKLPLMERKWRKISNTIKLKNYLLDNKSIIKKLRKRKFKLKEICKILNYKSYGTLSTFCKKHSI